MCVVWVVWVGLGGVEKGVRYALGFGGVVKGWGNPGLGSLQTTERWIWV